MGTDTKEKIINNIEKYELLHKTEKLVVLFSGGKDATFVLEQIVNYLRTNCLQIDLDVILVAYPLHTYFDTNNKEWEVFSSIKKFWASMGVYIKCIIPEADDLKDGDLNGCQICKNVRKGIIDNILRKYEENITIVTGYTLFDALAYLNMILLSTKLQPNKNIEKDKKTPDKLKNFVHKMHIKEYLPNNNIMIRPLLTAKETEIKDYLDSKKIPYLNTECKIAKFKYKRLYFNALSILGEYPTEYEDVLNFLNIDAISKSGDFSDIENDQYFIDC